MITQVFLTNKTYKKPLEAFLEKVQASYEFSLNIRDFKSDSIKRKPHTFFIQADQESTLQTLHLVADIRAMFGAISTIIIFGDKMPRDKLTNFLSEGADQFFSYPFDDTLIEDFLSKRSEKSYYNAFKFRNTPSRSSEIDIDFDVEVTEISTKGIILHSQHLIRNGALIKVNLKDLIPEVPDPIELKVFRSELLENNRYEIQTLFSEVDEKTMNEIIYKIRE